MGHLKAALVGAASSLLCTLLLLSTAYARADERTPQSFDIRPQGLAAALSEFARQSHEEILFAPDVVAEKQSAGVRGTMQPLAALKILLSDSGLPFSTTPSGAILIGQAGASRVISTAEAKDSSQKEGKKDSSQDFRVAQVDQTSPGAQVGQGQQAVALTEIVVTAQKRAQRLIDVPMSIVALGGDELQQRQLTSLEDLASAVPDLALARNGASYAYEIRGVSNISGTSPLVGLYIDDSDVTLGGTEEMQINPVTYDLERVEVLRGPQGTLYGDGSAGGTIRFVTKSPNLSQLSFDSQVAALFTDGGDPSQRVNAVVNVPVIQNELGLRVAITNEHDGGWIDQPAADANHINGQNLTNIRIKGLWQPDSQFTVSAMAIISRDDRGMDFSDASSPGIYTQVYNLPYIPRIRNNYDLYSLTTTYDFSPAARVLNTVSYLSNPVTEWNYGSVYQFTPPGTPPDDIFAPLTQITDHLLTDELRLTSVGSGPWQWTVGEFFRQFHETVDIPLNYFGPAPPGAPLPAPSPYAPDSRYKSWSTFGDTSYRLWDRLTVGVGVRYFRENQDFTNYTADFVDYTVVTRQTATFHSTDPRVYAQLKLAPEVNVYASAAKGFRSGGFNAVLQPTFGPESVWTYELGTKMALLEHRIAFDAAIFLSNYTAYQAFGVAPNGLSGSFNAGSARMKGVESDVTWQLLPTWRLEARGDYLDRKFTGFAPGNAYEVGDPIDFVPQYQFTLSGQHDFFLFEKQSLIRLDYSQQGPETYRNRNIQGPSPWFHSKSDVIHLLNLDSSVQVNDTLRVGFFAQNLLNDQGFTNPYAYIAQGVRSRPRTFGVQFSTSFH